MENILFTPSAVQRTLQNLKPTSSVGPDQIPNLLLKPLAFELSHPLCHIFDMSFKCQQLTQVWKHAFVTPVFKNGKLLHEQLQAYIFFVYVLSCNGAHYKQTVVRLLT